RNFILLALPWLSFQREMLAIAKKNVQDAGNIKPGEKFTMNELHALMMIFDPSRTYRSRLEPDFEKQVKAAYEEILPKVTSASVQLIEAQEQALSSAFEILNNLRKGDQAKDRSDAE